MFTGIAFGLWISAVALVAVQAAAVVGTAWALVGTSLLSWWLMMSARNIWMLHNTATPGAIHELMRIENPEAACEWLYWRWCQWDYHAGLLQWKQKER